MAETRRTTVYAIHRGKRRLSEPPEAAEAEVPQALTFEHHIGWPIPRHVEIDGLWSTFGASVHIEEVIVGHLWTEWIEVKGARIEVWCRKVVGDAMVTRSTASKAVVAFALAVEWAEKMAGEKQAPSSRRAPR